MENKVTISFDAPTHKYTDEFNREYTSATTIIGKYKEPFNKRYWSMYTTLKNANYKVRPTDDKKGIWVNNSYRTLESLYNNPINSHEVNLLVDDWKRKTIIACDRGNEVHDFLEDSINESKNDEKGESNNLIAPRLEEDLKALNLVKIQYQHELDRTNLLQRFPSIYFRLSEYIKIGCIIFAEKKVYSTTYLIAGMIDVLIVKGKHFAILDWKTNKDKMMFISGYYKKVKIGNKWIKGNNFIPTDNRLNFPLNNLQECKGIIYSLQLSLYAYIMELWGYKLVKNGLEIYHIRPNLEPKLIKVTYLRADIIRMLEHHKNTRLLGKVDSNENKPIKKTKFGF